MLTDRAEMSNLYRESSIDASYQVSDHLTKHFLEIDQSETKMTVAAMFVNGLGQMSYLDR